MEIEKILLLVCLTFQFALLFLFLREKFQNNLTLIPKLDPNMFIMHGSKIHVSEVVLVDFITYKNMILMM